MAGPEYSRILTKNYEQPLRSDVPPPKGAKSLAELTLYQPTVEDVIKMLPGLNQVARHVRLTIRP